MTTIAVEGMEFYAYHGYYAEERIIGGHYLVDVYLKVANIEAATKDDELGGTINYETVFEVCKAIMAKSVQLLEHLAQQLIEELQKLSDKLLHVKVRVSKLSPPLSGVLAKTYIEIESF